MSILGRVTTYLWADVRLIEVKDSLKNGGAATGAYLDFLREGREIIHRSHSPTASPAPMLLPRTVGLSAALEW